MESELTRVQIGYVNSGFRNRVSAIRGEIYFAILTKYNQLKFSLQIVSYWKKQKTWKNGALTYAHSLMQTAFKMVIQPITARVVWSNLFIQFIHSIIRAFWLVVWAFCVNLVPPYTTSVNYYLHLIGFIYRISPDIMRLLKTVIFDNSYRRTKFQYIFRK